MAGRLTLLPARCIDQRAVFLPPEAFVKTRTGTMRTRPRSIVPMGVALRFRCRLGLLLSLLNALVDVLLPLLHRLFDVARLVFVLGDLAGQRVEGVLMLREELLVERDRRILSFLLLSHFLP